jgi:hypothetical protein
MSCFGIRRGGVRNPARQKHVWRPAHGYAVVVRGTQDPGQGKGALVTREGRGEAAGKTHPRGGRGRARERESLAFKETRKGEEAGIPGPWGTSVSSQSLCGLFTFAPCTHAAASMAPL